MRLASTLALVFLVLPALARAQGPGTGSALPLAVDMQKVQVGAWSEYKMSMGSMTLWSRWALVARDDKSSTLESTTRGSRVAKQIAVRMVLPPDPTSDEKPPRPAVVQFGDEPPMLVPKDEPAQKFQRPEEKKLVGKEEIKVAAGTFKTAHYREKNPNGTVDLWVSETVFPLGIVKLVTTPEVDKHEPAAMQVPPAVMELVASGKGAKPVITKKPRPFNKDKMHGLVGGE
jgi:hypothetical protein